MDSVFPLLAFVFGPFSLFDKQVDPCNPIVLVYVFVVGFIILFLDWNRLPPLIEFFAWLNNAGIEKSNKCNKQGKINK